MLRKVNSWCSHFQGPGKCVMYSLKQLVKENTGENSGLLIPSPELPTVEMFALLLLEKSKRYLMFRSVCMKLSIDRRWVTWKTSRTVPDTYRALNK